MLLAAAAVVFLFWEQSFLGEEELGSQDYLHDWIYEKIQAAHNYGEYQM